MGTKQEELSYNRKKQMADSLKRLMGQKSLQKITIQEIADDCGINRYTFYYHFKDIYDLLAWMFEEEALSLIKKSDNCLTWEDGFLLFLRSVRENKAMFQRALDSLGRETLHKMFHRELSYLMGLFLADVGGERRVSDEFRAFLADFYIGALVSTVEEWLRRDIRLSEEQLLRYLRLTMADQIGEAFRRAEQEGL